MAEQTTGQNRFINVCDRLFHSRNTSYIEACETGRSQTSSSADIPILHQRRWLQWSRFDPQGSREILKRIKGPNIWPENSWLPSTNGGLKLGSNDCPIPWDDSIQVPCLKRSHQIPISAILLSWSSWASKADIFYGNLVRRRGISNIFPGFCHCHSVSTNTDLTQRRSHSCATTPDLYIFSPKSTIFHPHAYSASAQGPRPKLCIWRIT